MKSAVNPFPDSELADAAELGAVDDRSVRVWIRQPGAHEARAELVVAGRSPVAVTISLSAATDWTGVALLCVPEPAPGQPFTVVVDGRRLTARFAPADTAREGLVFAFGSCNRPFALTDDGRIGLNRGAGLYPAMAENLKQAQARFLLLIGDQLYSDGVPSISVRDGLSGDEAHPPPLSEAIAAYRRVTRGYLGQAGFRAVRETLPTYWMWDDHDIFNNWGSRRQESPLDQRLFAAATHVYGEYQHVRNPGGVPGPPPFFYVFRFGTIGFAVLDLRRARDYDVGRLMGARQWEDVRAYLAGSDAASLETLFVVATVPIAHHARWLVEALSHLPQRAADDARDRWCAPHFVQSRDELLDELFGWQALRPERQVIVLSGDVHCASAFTIRRQGEAGVIQQWTSSALSTPTTGVERFANVVGTRAPNLFEPRFRFRRRFVTIANNFGLVRVEPLADGGHRVEFTVRAWRPERNRLENAGRAAASPGTNAPELRSP